MSWMVVHGVTNCIYYFFFLKIIKCNECIYGKHVFLIVATFHNPENYKLKNVICLFNIDSCLWKLLDLLHCMIIYNVFLFFFFSLYLLALFLKICILHSPLCSYFIFAITTQFIWKNFILWLGCFKPVPFVF